MTAPIFDGRSNAEMAQVAVVAIPAITRDLNQWLDRLTEEQRTRGDAMLAAALGLRVVR